MWAGKGSEAVTYAEQLTSRGYGHPLFDPSPAKSKADVVASDIRIGDVGYLYEGAFHRLFNVILSEADVVNSPGVPDDFTQLEYNQQLHFEPRRYLDPGVYCSKSMSCKVLKGDIGAGASTIGAEASFDFSCQATAGAVLVLTDPAFREVVMPNGAFSSYMRTNFEKWRAYAVNKIQLDKEIELVLVQGSIKTTRWSISTFSERTMIRGMSMQIQGGNTAQLNVSAKFKNEHSSSPVVKSGPPNYKPKKSPRDQCVFLSYYKCRFRNRPIFGVKANAGDHELPDHRDEDGIPEDANPEEDENIDVEGVPAIQAHMDPVDILLEYILKYAPEAECAIACYGDIQDLFFNDDEWPEDLREYLYAHLPTIDIDESKTGMLSMEQAIRRQHLREEAAIAPIREAQQAAIRERGAVYWEPQADDTDARDDPPPPEDRTLDRRLPETKEMPGQPGNLLAATIVLAKDAPGRTRILDWPRHVLYNGGVVSSLTVSKDGTHIAAGFDDSFVRVWDLQTSVVFQLQGHSDNVWATMFSPSENNKLVSGSADKTAIIWDVSTCDIARTLSAPDITGSVYTVAYAPDGKTIATGSDNGFVYLWDADTGERKHHLKVHASVGLVLAFSPMGNRLVCVVTKGWIWDPVSGQQLGMIEGHVDGIVSCMAFSPDGSRILTGADDQTARVWSSENGEELVTLREHTAAVWAVAWSPDSQHVATGGLDETIVVCNSYSGEIIHLLRDRPSPVTTLLWTEDLLIAGAADGTVRLWNDKTGAFVAELQGHIDRVNTTVLAKGGVNVVSSAEDGTIRKWDMRDILRF